MVNKSTKKLLSILKKKQIKKYEIDTINQTMTMIFSSTGIIAIILATEHILSALIIYNLFNLPSHTFISSVISFEFYGFHSMFFISF